MTDEFTTPTDTEDEDLEAGDEPGTDEELDDDAPLADEEPSEEDGA